MSEYFFIAGAQRSGTTYLYNLLDEHPEIEMAKPLRPEPKFFLKNHLYERGVAYYKRHFWKNKPGVRIRGEKSVSYMESEIAVQRIASDFPSAKIVFLLRNPVERAISNYWYSVENGLETLTISEAFLREEQRRENYDATQISISPYAYLKRGCYAEFLAVFDAFFPRQNIKIMLFEHLINSPAILRDLYTFLNANPSFLPPSLNQVANSSARRDIEVDSELKQYLIEYFRIPNSRLSSTYGLDLSAWSCFTEN